MNHAYLRTIRANSCYPTFRGVVTAVTICLYIVAALVVVATLVSVGSAQYDGVALVVAVVLGNAVAAVIALVAKVGQEVSLMVADIADATIDSAGRKDQPAATPAQPPKSVSSGSSSKQVAKQFTEPTPPHIFANMPIEEIEEALRNAGYEVMAGKSPGMRIVTFDGLRRNFFSETEFRKFVEEKTKA